MGFMLEISPPKSMIEMRVEICNLFEKNNSKKCNGTKKTKELVLIAAKKI